MVAVIPPYVVSISELSSLPGNMPMRLDIARAMRQAAEGLGTWIGAEPRVVRRTDSTSLRGFETVVTWPIQFPDDRDLPGRIEMLANNVRSSLRDSDRSIFGDWSEVYIRPFSESINGPLSFWSDGTAANSARTRDMARWGPERAVLPEENPYGPDDIQDVDPTALETAEQVGERLREQARRNLQLGTSTLWDLLPIAAVGAVLWLAVTAGPSILKAKYARSNPTRRRRR